MLVSSNPETDSHFTADVDNLLKLKPIRNLLTFEVPAYFVSVKGDFAQFIPVGVVQLINKREDHAFPFVTNRDLVSHL